MNSKLLALLLFASLTLLTSCDDDDDDTVETFSAPRVTAPTAITDAEQGGSGSVTFNTSVDSKLTANYTATGSNVSVTNASGAVSGSSVTINFTAGTTAGPGSVKLTITDSEGQSSEGTAVINVTEEEDMVLVTNNITSNTTWTADKVYVLGGRIAVESGATLTIEAGTIVKGQAGTGANATALLVARGGTLMAEGTAAAPIIFTSVADEISPEDIAAGNFASPNLDSDINGLWGGVIVLGHAPISASNDNGDVIEIGIEGIPTSDPNGLYGGNDAADNSGVLRYISIRHGGTNIGAGNEINGLTLGGVGTGTVIENIEIVANQDDGVEWFGGSVNVNNVLVWNVGDDGIDTDQAWTGTLDNFIVVASAGHCFELDGPEGTAAGSHTIQNGTVVASDPTLGRNSEDLINVDNNSEVTLRNIHITGIVDGQRVNRVDAPLVTFENITLDVPTDMLQNFINGEIPSGITAGGSPAADKTAFEWTWAAQAGGLESL